MNSPNTLADPALQRRGYTLGMLVAVFASSHLDRNIMGLLGEYIRLDLGITDSQLGAMTGFAFALFYASLGLPMAMWADRTNRRNVVALSISLWSIMTALGGFAQNYWQLLIARIGVGVGEAGSNPPSHSMIADLYGPHERATAMGIFSTGISFGVLLGFLAGGWLNEWFGWRMTFVIVGLPGVVLGLLVFLTVPEPRRGTADGITQTRAPPPVLAVFRSMLGDPVMPLVVLGGTCCAFVGYALILWLPVFFVRTHGLTSGQIGTAFALIAGLIGAVGVYATGRLADRLAPRGEGWRMRILAIGLLLALPFLIAAVSVPWAGVALACYTLPAIVGAFQAGPIFALIQTRTALEKRAVAASVNLFIANIVGLGVGPFYVGVMSDALKPVVGDQSLGWALASLGVVYVIGAGLFLWAALRLDRDAGPGVGAVVGASAPTEAVRG